MKLVIFDIDGTLGDTNALDHDAFKTAFRRVSGVQDLPSDLWEGCPHITDTGVSQHLYQKLFQRFATATEIEAIKNELVNVLYEMAEDVSAYTIPGARDFLVRLRQEKDMAVAIATGCWKSNADTKFELLQIDVSGIPMAVADQHLSRKHISLDAIAQSILHYEQSSFERISYVGDGLWDLRTSSDLGLHFVGIDCKGNGVLKEHGAETVFRDYRDTEALMKALRQ